MANELVLEGKTKTGELDFKLAAAACYVPMMFIHVIAAVLFLATEPKEHRFVRFHAVQSLILAALFVGGSLVALIGGMMVLPALVFVIGGVLGGVLSAVSQDLADGIMAITALLAMASYFLGALVSIALSMAFLPAFLLNLFLVLTGKVARWPVIGGLAERFV